MVESNAHKPSSYAVKLMEKMGWKEGQGLGRKEDGITKHLTIQKREENIGLGHDKLIGEVESATDHWWSKSFAQNLAAFKTSISASDSDSDSASVSSSNSSDKEIHRKNTKRNRKDREDKPGKKKSQDSENSGKVNSEQILHQANSKSADNPTLEELFLLTGGKMFGMRARRQQKGKILRTESDNRLLALLEEKKSGQGISDDSSIDEDKTEKSFEKKDKKKIKKEKKRHHEEAFAEEAMTDEGGISELKQEKKKKRKEEKEKKEKKVRKEKKEKKRDVSL